MDDSIGQAVTIVKAEDHTFQLNEEELQNILFREEIRDKKIVVLSVAGAFRKGKSFLLNFMLRYLESQGAPLWLGKDDEPLKGFSWRGGSERDTTGIMMWNKVYLVSLPDGEEVAVILMDTQGAFDSSSTVKECATVFALSTMLSSIQVYNLSQNIQEDDLQHLELFAEYGRLALEDINETPFQKLIFLVRDWSYPYDAHYGLDGGKDILDRRLQISEKQHPQLQQLRRHIKACFSEVGCFLMPHPGLEVATNAMFDGRLADIRDEFKHHLQSLMPQLLSPENLVSKKIGGRCITAKELITYFKSYTEIFKGDELPEPKSMLQATAEANNLSAIACAKDYYSNVMEKVCGGSRPFLNVPELEAKHLQTRESAVQQFTSTRRMGSVDLSNEYLGILEKEIDEMYSSFVRFNDSKKISNVMRTPATLCGIIIFTFFFSYLLSALTLTSASFLVNTLMAICVVSLVGWAYARYSGEYQDLSDYIDTLVAYLLINFVFPGQRAIMDKVASMDVTSTNNTTLIEPSSNATSTRPQQKSIHLQQKVSET